MAGLGEIAFTGGKGASGEWHDMFEPVPTRAFAEEGENRFFGRVVDEWAGWDGRSDPLSASLAEDADISLPSTGWIMFIIGAYIAVIGPGVWLVLKAVRRPELGWAAVPLVAVVFTAGIWAFGSTFRNKIKPAHGTVIEVAPRGTVATVYSLLHSTSGGRDSMPMHQGWSFVPVWSEDQRYAFDITESAAGLVGSVELDTAGFAVIGSKGGYREFDDVLQVTAKLQDDDQIVGTVVNKLHVDLHDVIAFTSQGAMSIGKVPAGATAEFDYKPISHQPVPPVLPLEFFGDSQPQPAEFKPFEGDEILLGEPPKRSELVSSGLLSELNFGWSLNARPGGQIGVAAWTDELNAPLDPQVSAGRTLLIARNAIEADGRSLNDLAVPRTVVRGPDEVGLHSMGFNAADFGFMFAPELEGLAIRFLLPEDVPKEDIVLVVPEDALSVEIWTGDGWRWIDLGTGSGMLPFVPDDLFVPDGMLASGDYVFPLPLDSIDNGRVHLRVLLNSGDWGAFGSFWKKLAIRNRRDGEELSKLSYLEGEVDIAEFIAGLSLDPDAIFNAGFGGIDLDFDGLGFDGLDFDGLGFDTDREWEWEMQVGEDTFFGRSESGRSE